MREKKFGKLFLTWLLAATMVLTLLPVGMLAADDETDHVLTVGEQRDEDDSGGGISEGNGEGEEPPTVPEHAAKIVETGGMYQTVAMAIAAAGAGQTVELLKDVTESITISKSLTLDLNGKTLTGDGMDSVVTITGENTIVTIMSSALNEDEFVKNGSITGGGNSGIRINSADVTLNAVNVTKNTTADNGGGIYIRDGELTAVDSYITDNNAVGQTEHFEKGNTFGDIAGSYGGGGIYARSSDVTLNHVYVTDNMVTGEAMDGGGILIKDATLNIHQHSSISQNNPDRRRKRRRCYLSGACQFKYDGFQR